MTNGESTVGGNRTSPPVEVQMLRERVTTRRRRARKDRRPSGKWIAARSRRQKVRTLAVCAGTLLLMALALYFGLARQESPGPVESATPLGATGIV